ncbi:MAG: hypothetical protein WCK13_08525 [Ignavibacteriota bacterium]
MIDSILNKAKDAAKGAVSNVSDKLVSFKDNIIGDEQNEIAENFKESSSNKVKEVLDSINESMALITSSGYEFKGIGVSLGLAPSISLSFHYLRDIPEEARNSILEQAEDKKMIKIVIKLLFKAGDYYKAVKLGDYALDAVNMSLGLSPGMSVTFKKI